MIDVRRDLAGLRVAADALYEESFQAKQLESVLASMDVEQVPSTAILEAVESYTPPRTVSHGYFVWALYLMWLRQITELPGVQIDMLADEVEGILVIRAAETHFRNTHKSCYKCGVYNVREAGCCRECMADFGD